MLNPLISNQPIYNMFERYIEQEVMPLSDREGIGQIVFSPLAQGVLTGKYKPGQPLPAGSRGANESVNGVIKSYFRDEVLQVVQQLDNVAKELGLALSQLALAWVLRQKGVSSALIGATKPSQIEENVKAVGVALTSDVLKQIEDILAQVKDFAPLR
jgi:aryl-alcohol dehydrogenase-like predicted oxidoreductase